MKQSKLSLLVSTLAAIVVAASIGGCALLNPDSPQSEKERDIQAVCFAAGSLATEITLIEKPAARPALELAYANLNKLVNDGAVTGSLLRGIVAALPFKELSEPTARAVVNSLTVLFDATVGDRLNIESAPFALAAAIGLRDGMKVALGQ